MEDALTARADELATNARSAALSLRPRVVAIDGPASSGKSTVGAEVARVIDFLFFDTGVMYRAVTWLALAHAIEPGDEVAVSGLAQSVALDVLPPESEDGHANRVLADGQDVSGDLRRPEVDRNVSRVSAYAGVRTALSSVQRSIGARYGAGSAEKPGVVMVGRDIGTVVMPNAALKVYLDASADVRAQRRFDELALRGKDVPFDQVLAELLRRDETDSQRALSPLRVADDAQVLDTSQMAVDEVVSAILRLIVTYGE